MSDDKKKVCLKLENVSKVFAKVESDGVTHALQDVSTEMQSGEFVSLVGPSGCGKSTILRLVAGLITPTLGRVMVDGKEVDGPSPERGLVFQNPTLFPWLTVEKNISFSLDMQGATVGKAEKVKHMLEITGLEKFKNDYPAQLSGGMAQRVALVRTLINEPEILLLDEPLGALDAFTRMNMQDEILNIWTQRRQLALMVTHSIDEAVYMGTRVLVMEANPGRIVADIKISEDFPRDRSSASFVEYRNEILNKLHYGGKNA